MSLLWSDIVVATTNDTDETLTFAVPEPGEMTIVVDYTAPLTDTMMEFILILPN